MIPIILEVNLKNIIHNYNELKKISKKTIVAVVVKANAYGTGVKIVSKKLIKEGCKDFFVATLKEGVARAEAEEFFKQLEEAGAKAELK